MGRKFMIGAQVAATLLFIANVGRASSQNWLAWAVPLVTILLIVVNSVWFTRFVSWIIFSTSFFGLLVVLSAFTLRWRGETGFAPGPFYRTMAMYVAFIYVSLAQIKILGGGSPASVSSDHPRANGESTL